MSFEKRIIDLGIKLPSPAKPAGSYKPCIIVDSFAYISGQGPLLEDGSFATGIVGQDIDKDIAKFHAERCGLAILSALKNEVGSLDKVNHLIKLNGFVCSTTDFHEQPFVVNGCSELMKNVFGNNGIHARSAVGVISLPLKFSVEIDAIFSIKI